VEVDVLRHVAAGMAVQMKFDHIVLANPDKLTRDATAECPECILDAIGKAVDDLAHFQVHNHFCGMVAADWRWN
jgi:hypothetical protein